MFRAVPKGSWQVFRDPLPALAMNECVLWIPGAGTGSVTAIFISEVQDG